MNWSHGYFAHAGYTHGYYPEMEPTRLHLAALLKGVITPQRRFRYLDLGCGQGLNLACLAALHPEAEFVGVDFMPEHVAHGRSLAREADLTNVRYLEADFLSLRSDAKLQLGEFDYIVSHGVTSWVTQNVVDAIFDIVSSCLSPNGLFYNSYNTLPGWVSGLQFQHLVMAAERNGASGHEAIALASEVIRSLNSAEALSTRAMPAIAQRVDKIRELDAAYLVQEYNNEGWQPRWVDEVHDRLSARKLKYLTTANLGESFENQLPNNLKALLNSAPKQISRELLKDLYLNQSFRRDIYTKGRFYTWKVEQRNRLEAMCFERVRLRPLPGIEKPFSFQSSGIEVTGDPEVYGNFASYIEESSEGRTVRDLQKQFNKSQEEIVIMATMMTHGGWIAPRNPSYPVAAASTQRMNAVLSASAAKGAPYKVILSPRTAGFFHVSEIDQINFAGRTFKTRSERVRFVKERLSILGRTVLIEGKPPENEAATDKLLEDAIDAFDKNLKLWEEMEMVAK